MYLNVLVKCGKTFLQAGVAIRNYKINVICGAMAERNYNISTKNLIAFLTKF